VVLDQEARKARDLARGKRRNHAAHCVVIAVADREAELREAGEGAHDRRASSAAPAEPHGTAEELERDLEYVALRI
jgi:hypothetical protein